MRLLILGMNYAPERSGIGPFTSELAVAMETRGHDVEVLTSFPHYPEWRFNQPPTIRRRSEVREGVLVHRHWVRLPRRRGALQRVMYDTSLALSTLRSALFARRPDLILCVVPPLQLGLTAFLVSGPRRIPLIVHVQDLVPDVAIATGMLNRGPATWMAAQLGRMIYRLATVVTVISAGFKDRLVQDGVDPGKIMVLPNWVDVDAIAGCPASHKFRVAAGASEGDITVLHAGNMGEKQGLETVLGACELLQDAPIRVALVGDGIARRGLEALARQRGLPGVTFLPFQEDLGGTLRAADVAVLCQRKDVSGSVAPSKLLTYMAAGRPVLASVAKGSEAARVIAASACGMVIPPEDPVELARAVRALAADPALRHRMGQAGQDYARRHFDKAATLDHWHALLEQYANNPAPRPLAGS